ncbi:MAG: furin-like repeat-containing protein [Nitrosopumilaceae archaeon]
MAVCLFVLSVCSIPTVEAKVAEPYVLRYDLQDRKMVIEKIIHGEEGVIWSDPKWHGPHDTEGKGDEQRQQILPFYKNNETFLFQFVDDFGIYTIFKVNLEGKGLEVLWRDNLEPSDRSHNFALFDINDNPHLFRIDTAGSWKLEKIMINEKRLQIISQGQGSAGLNGLVSFQFEEKPYLFLYNGGNNTTNEWQIWKIIGGKDNPKIEAKGIWNSELEILGFNIINPHLLSWNINGIKLYQINSDGNGISNIFDSKNDFDSLGTHVKTFDLSGDPYILNYNQTENEESYDVLFYKIKYRDGFENVGQAKWGAGWDEVVSFTMWEDTCTPGNHLENGECVPNSCSSGFHLENGECVPNVCSTGMQWDLEQEQCVVIIQGGGCLIATATYDSELHPTVQMLREIRDNKLTQTQSGSAFIKTFNNFYYSFSPIIADYERENPVFKEAVKITITPMILSLSIFTHVDLDSEIQVLGYGVSLILLNVVIYGGIPSVGFYLIKNRIKRD